MCSCRILIVQKFPIFWKAQSTIISATPNSSSDTKGQDKAQEGKLATITTTKFSMKTCALSHNRFLTFNAFNYHTVALPRNASLQLSIYLVLVRHCPLQSFPTGIPPAARSHRATYSWTQSQALAITLIHSVSNSGGTWRLYFPDLQPTEYANSTDSWIHFMSFHCIRWRV